MHPSARRSLPHAPASTGARSGSTAISRGAIELEGRGRMATTPVDAGGPASTCVCRCIALRLLRRGRKKGPQNELQCLQKQTPGPYFQKSGKAPRMLLLLGGWPEESRGTGAGRGATRINHATRIICAPSLSLRDRRATAVGE